MDKAEAVFNKYAFLAVTPFDIKDKKEYKSGKGYAKEWANKVIGVIGGGITGGLAGMGIGALAALPFAKGKSKAARSLARAAKSNHKLNGKTVSRISVDLTKPDIMQSATMAGGIVGAVTGGITGEVRSIRKGEREAGVKQTGLGSYLGRSVAGAVAGSVVPVIGAPVGDYYASRELRELKPVKKKKG